MELQTARTTGRKGFSWSKKYTYRRAEGYRNENDRLGNRVTQQGSRDNTGELITLFMKHRRANLDPEDDHQGKPLQRFLETALPSRNRRHSNIPAEIIVLDDRRDPSGSNSTTRVWDAEGPIHYLNRPPEGEKIVRKALPLAELQTILSSDVSSKLHVSKRSQMC